ncbi:MAG: phosphatase PAP2 family protein [Bdellovibrionota bacterium]
MDFIILFDQRLFEFLNSTLTHPWLDVFFPFLTDLHKSAVFQFTAYPMILIALYLKFGKKSLGIFLSLVLCIACTDFIGSQVIKNNVGRLRPGDNPKVQSLVKSPYGGTSFISNHSANMFAFAIFMSVFFPTMTIPFFVLAALVAYSRIYVGVHFPLDVLGGAFLGLFTGKIFSKIFVLWFKINLDQNFLLFKKRESK